VRRASDADARDPLTGLLHRAALLAALDDPVPPSAARAADGVFAVRLDVEGVGACNRDLGFAAGDTVLLAVAEALRRVVRRRDLVARWSGTRFVVVGHQRHDGGDGVDALCSRLRDALTGDVLVGGRRTELDTRLTVVRQGVDETVVDLLRRLEVTVTRVHGREDGAVGSGHGPARR
jgi:diguanylate cyclase (GGDEF)-like protein